MDQADRPRMAGGAAERNGRVEDGNRGVVTGAAPGAAGGAGALWNQVQEPLHEMVNVARDLERHLDGIHGARARKLRQLAEEVVSKLKPERS